MTLASFGLAPFIMPMPMRLSSANPRMLVPTGRESTTNRCVPGQKRNQDNQIEVEVYTPPLLSNTALKLSNYRIIGIAMRPHKNHPGCEAHKTFQMGISI